MRVNTTKRRKSVSKREQALAEVIKWPNIMANEFDSALGCVRAAKKVGDLSADYWSLVLHRYRNAARQLKLVDPTFFHLV